MKSSEESGFAFSVYGFRIPSEKQLYTSPALPTIHAQIFGEA